MDLSSPKLIAENLKSQNRNKIRKALKNDIRIFNGRFAEIYNTFREIYNQTMDKVQAKPYYYFKEDYLQTERWLQKELNTCYEDIKIADANANTAAAPSAVRNRNKLAARRAGTKTPKKVNLLLRII